MYGRSLLKYFADKGGPEHGGTLHWPGTLDGFPFRGDKVPNLTQQEMENIPLALDFKSKSFRQWIAEEKKEFDKVMDCIANGIYMQHKRFDNYVPEHMEYVTRLEWVQIYGEHPAGRDGGNGFDARNETLNLAESITQNGQPLSRPEWRREQIRRREAQERGTIVVQDTNYNSGQTGGLMGTPGTPY